MKTAGIQRGSREFEELAPYLKAVRDYPPLTRDEEHALALKARKGEVGAKQKLVRHNLAFVVAIAPTASRNGAAQRPHPGRQRGPDARQSRSSTRTRDPVLDLRVWSIRAYVGKYLKRAARPPQSGTVAQPDLSLDTTSTRTHVSTSSAC